MRLPSFFRLAFVSVSFATVLSASAAEPLVLKLPCDSEPFRKCSDLKRILIEGSAELKQPGIKGTVADLMKDVYEGKTKVVAQSEPGSGACSTLNLVGKPEVCPPLKVSENGCKDEFTTNKNDKQCAPISKVGTKGTGQYYFTLGKSDTGSLETANISGGLVVAISDRAMDVVREINANAFTITPQSACYAQGLALKSLIQAQSDVKLLNLVKGCDITQTETCSTKNYFNANLTTIESAYVLLARCRITDEATNRFRSFALDYQNRIEQVIVKDCFYNFEANPTGMKACYQSKYTNWIRARAKEAFPNAASVCQN